MLLNQLHALIYHQELSIATTLRTTTGRTLEQSEGEFSLSTVAKQKTFDLNTDYYLTAPQIVASAINETNEMSGSKSLNVVIYYRLTNR